MKTIGLIGGMDWEATAEYYRVINDRVRAIVGGNHCAKILICSIDYHDIERYPHEGQWERAAEVLIDAAQQLVKGGADLLALCTNTMHKLAPQVAVSVQLPLVHIAEAVAERLAQDGLKTVGLLGTKFTMEEGFFVDRLVQAGITVFVPGAIERRELHRIIYEELLQGVTSASSRSTILRTMEGLRCNGAEGIILGGGRLPALIHQRDYLLPLYYTNRIHAEYVVRLALAEG